MKKEIQSLHIAVTIRVSHKRKSEQSMKSVPILVRIRGQIRFASNLLVHPNAEHFGTGLRNSGLKTIINRFLNARCLLKVQVLFC